MVTGQDIDAAAQRMRQIWSAALQLRQVWQDGEYCDPIRGLLEPGDYDAAYAVQNLNNAHWLAQGREMIGRKMGATSQPIQEMMGVDFPDFGVLFADMQVQDGATVPMSSLHQPFVEAEVAVVLKHDLKGPETTLNDIADSIDYMVPAIEIIGSRINGWDLKMMDTIADNASSSHFILGETPYAIDDFDVFGAKMTIYKNAEIASQGDADVCMGSPLFSLIWLATEAVRQGKPLRAGEVVLTGAMGPIVPVEAGDEVQIEIEGMGALGVRFSAD